MSRAKPTAHATPELMAEHTVWEARASQYHATGGCICCKLFADDPERHD